MKPAWSRDELIHILSLSATLAGLSITGVTLFHTMGNVSTTATVVDDIFGVTALLFLLCCYISFWALRSRRSDVTIRLIWLADALFLSGLTSMVASGFMMLYTLW